MELILSLDLPLQQCALKLKAGDDSMLFFAEFKPENKPHPSFTISDRDMLIKIRDIINKELEEK